ncbi:MAG: flagellar biosynthetic protein FliR [Proteobacteria bacterium]|nr:MAG: flagellar biosynthetic protein FliR [Pseudomonadota bacterium]
MVISTDEFAGFVTFALWPFLRVAALIGTAPVFSSDMVPMRIRVVMALAVTAMVLPVLPQTPSADPLSAQGVLISAQQILIGVAMGFALRLVFSALTVAGQTVATSMGLGFASTIDPQNGVQVPVVSQLYVILATLLFLVFNGHLMLIEMVARSFQSLPVAVDGLTRNGLWALVSWGSDMFAGAMLIAMPVVASILLLNISFGVITRAAPQLNIFAVGFPLTIMMGFIILWLTLPGIVPQFERLLMDGLDMTARLVGPGE